MMWMIAMAWGADGAELFFREWTEGDERARFGDGLGPTYNEASCVACHNQGGAGGAGGNDKNVNMTVRPDGSSAVVHRVSRFDDLSRNPGELGLFGLGNIASTRNPPPKLITHFGGLFLPPARNTPALFGMGLLDAIPVAELEVLEAEGTPGFPEISGRLARNEQGEPGRFGWRGQSASAFQFTENACANELGLQTASVDQPGTAAPGVDIDEGELGALTAYITALPRPLEVPSAGAARGHEVFDEVGCAACHRGEIGGVQGAYTDLMVHDMGPALVDQAGGYGFQPQPQADQTLAASPSEWRTPPLWGLRDSAPYLHDGRARTVQDAILAHGGEAQKTVDRYQALAAEQKADLQSFLTSLVAPGTPGADYQPRRWALTSSRSIRLAESTSGSIPASSMVTTQ